MEGVVVLKVTKRMKRDSNNELVKVDMRTDLSEKIAKLECYSPFGNPIVYSDSMFQIMLKQR